MFRSRKNRFRRGHPFPSVILKHFTAINLKLGIKLPHGSLEMPIDFGIVTSIFKVTEVTKVKFGFWSITQKVLELSL